MRASLAISTLLKGVEVSAGAANTRAAVSAVSEAIAATPAVVDLTQPTAIEVMMATVREMAPAD